MDQPPAPRLPRLRPQRRAIVFDALAELQTLRNRIAHHEPIHHRALNDDAVTIYRLLDWIDADVRSWALENSRVKAVLGAKPSPDSE